MDPHSEYCVKQLLNNGYDAFYAFETARELLLHKEPDNTKILTNADLSRLASLFPDILFRKRQSEHAYLSINGRGVRFYVSHALPYGIKGASNRMEIKKRALTSATFYTPFLINGFFYDVEDRIFYDPLDAYLLLKSGVIKTNRSPSKAFESFPLLALKAAKAISETGFTIDEELYTFLKVKAPLTGYVKMSEAIAQDFIDICSSRGAYRTLGLLDDWRVLDIIFPELTQLKEIDQDKEHHPEGNVFFHTLHCLKCVKKPNKNLMMAILLHDAGKALTKENGKSPSPFPEHSSASKLIARRVLNRFFFSDKDMDEVLFLVRNHMILGSVDRLSGGRLKKLFGSPYIQNLLELYRADIESGYHPSDKYYNVARKYREFQRKQKFISQGTYVKYN
jgi:tRNA nucleotidyltransferase/poly(A) polymerase